MILGAHADNIENLKSSNKGLRENKAERVDMDNAVYELKEMIQALVSGKPVKAHNVEKPRSRGGARITQEDTDRWNDSAMKMDKQDKINRDLLKGIEHIDKLKEDLLLVES